MVVKPALDWLRPSAVEGMLRLRREISLTGDPLHQVEQRLNAVYANAGMDWEVARALLHAFPSGSAEHQVAFRQVIECVIREQLPPWLALIPRGRSFLLDALSVDVAECFRRAGALEDFPSGDVVLWLDSLSALARIERDLRLGSIGRTGERLSFELEVTRLNELEGAPAVEWVALNDNTAGYDIRSYDHVDGEFKGKLIEVKSSSSGNREFFLTRHEWEVAQRARSSYWIHLWDLRTNRLEELTFEDLATHIPLDHGSGRWTEIRISLGS